MKYLLLPLLILVLSTCAEQTTVYIEQEELSNCCAVTKESGASGSGTPSFLHGCKDDISHEMCILLTPDNWSSYFNGSVFYTNYSNIWVEDVECIELIECDYMVNGGGSLNIFD